MPKLFGEFLVDQQVISEEQLAIALVNQVKLMPATVEVIFQRKLLPNHKIIEILKCQQTTGRDFRSAAKFLGIWTKDLEISVTTLLEQARTPLGEVLVQLGFVTPMILTQSLDRYIVNSSSIDPDIYDSLITQFLKEARDQLEPQIRNTLTTLSQGNIKENLQDTSQKMRPLFENLIATLKRISVISSPMRADPIHFLIRELNISLTHLYQKSGQVDQDILNKFLNSCLKVITLLSPSMLRQGNDLSSHQEFQNALSEFNIQNQMILSDVNKTVA